MRAVSGSWQGSVVLPEKACISANGRVTAKSRAKLVIKAVIDIFKMKASDRQASSIGRVYGVSEKAIRDIWSGRTWARVTWHLDQSRMLTIKQLGRPVGRKDSRQRLQRSATRLHVLKIFRVSPSKYHELDEAFSISLDLQLSKWDEWISSNTQKSDPFTDDWEEAKKIFFI